ncbi:hypothetical protein GUITHDRAFT_111722 [Guillardia theta CCMP2712]|uniref:PDZ domain-containing protein n=1 Tax=Guillardia theta (strain CCMP2712) TaxID=905079 RepID=L1J235_GUITC|nr:hypothetical protein GUITHDRAFT_111722 [Guillardia theta CCMP2712]EKX42155.1 hypothetical protein GUITHDRAFT_111722 [Guillardia theta CCMP2712]|eukprot:XP_005829135.1 hypothetical protein GUITHDRAFT_111722 [Guillardia theta CCMP2712]
MLIEFFLLQVWDPRERLMDVMSSSLSSARSLRSSAGEGKEENLMIRVLSASGLKQKGRIFLDDQEPVFCQLRVLDGDESDVQEGRTEAMPEDETDVIVWNEGFLFSLECSVWRLSYDPEENKDVTTFLGGAVISTSELAAYAGRLLKQDFELEGSSHFGGKLQLALLYGADPNDLDLSEGYESHQEGESEIEIHDYPMQRVDPSNQSDTFEAEDEVEEYEDNQEEAMFEPQLYDTELPQRLSNQSSPPSLQDENEHDEMWRGGDDQEIEMKKRLESSENNSGVGISLEADSEGNVVIVSLRAGGSAESSGQVKPGDRICGIDGQDIRGLSVPDILDRIVGPSNTRVSLDLMDADRSDGHVKRVMLRRMSSMPLQIQFDQPFPDHPSYLSQGAQDRYLVPDVSRASDIDGKPSSLFPSMQNQPVDTLASHHRPSKQAKVSPVPSAPDDFSVTMVDGEGFLTGESITRTLSEFEMLYEFLIGNYSKPSSMPSSLDPFDAHRNFAVPSLELDLVFDQQGNVSLSLLAARLEEFLNEVLADPLLSRDTYVLAFCEPDELDTLKELQDSSSEQRSPPPPPALDPLELVSRNGYASSFSKSMSPQDGKYEMSNGSMALPSSTEGVVKLYMEKLAEKDRQIAHMSIKLSAAEHKVSSATQREAELEEELKRLKAGGTARFSTGGEGWEEEKAKLIAGFKEQIEMLQASHKEGGGRLSAGVDSRSSAGQLQEVMQKLSEANQESNRLKVRLGELEVTLRSVEEERAQLQREVKTAKWSPSEEEEDQGRPLEVSELRRRVRELQEELSSERERLNQQRRQAQTLETNLSESKVMVEQLQQELEVAQMKVTHSRNLSQEVEDKELEISSLGEKCAILSKRNEQLLDELEALRKSSDELKAQVGGEHQRGRREDREEAMEELDSLRRQLMTQQDEIKFLKSKLADERWKTSFPPNSLQLAPNSAPFGNGQTKGSILKARQAVEELKQRIVGGSSSSSVSPSPRLSASPQAFAVSQAMEYETKIAQLMTQLKRERLALEEEKIARQAADELNAELLESLQESRAALPSTSAARPSYQQDLSWRRSDLKLDGGFARFVNSKRSEGTERTMSPQLSSTLAKVQKALARIKSDMDI